MARLASSRISWIVILLATMGLSVSVLRAWVIFDTGVLTRGGAPEISRIDEMNTRLLAVLLEVEPGTAQYDQVTEETVRFLGRFTDHPLPTLLHVVPAALFMILAPIQFAARFRSRHLRWHRWTGRFLVAIAIPIAISGLYFGIVMPFSGALESYAIAAFGGFFLVALVRGFAAIRRGNVASHRRWMTRMFAVALGVSTIRVVDVVLALIVREGPETWFASSVWIGFGLTVLAAELWIRHTSVAGASMPERRMLAGTG